MTQHFLVRRPLVFGQCIDDTFLVSDDERLYQRLYVSLGDLSLTNSFARHLRKKKWHYAPHERRWTTYIQQAAFTSALVTSYARAFTPSKGWPDIPVRLRPYDDAEVRLHEHLIALRNKVYAHSDSSSYSVRPMRIADHPSAIIGAPIFRLSSEELTALQKMLDKVSHAISQELENLMSRIEQAQADL